MIALTDFQIALLRQLQNPLPICEQPFARIAESLNTSQQDVIDAIIQFKEAGIIRRFRAQLNYRALGRIASLVTAHVPDEKFEKVSEAINRLAGVSHHYVRDHHYNLWFTLQGTSLIAIDVMLAGLTEEFEIEFHSLPATCLFKLDVRFDPTGPELSVTNELTAQSKESILSDVPEMAELTGAEVKVLTAAQKELPIGESPFNEYVESMDAGEVVQTLQQLQQKGIVRKISAVLNYPLLGYTANALFCAEVPPKRITTVGIALAANPMVSHCYERKTFNGWPFNLYGMCHAGDVNQIEDVIRPYCARHAITHFQLLPTVKELKKQPVIIDPNLL